MYFRNNQGKKFLTIDDSFAHLKSISDNGDLEFEFTYSVAQRDVISKKALKVNIEVESRNVAKKPLLGTSHRGQVDVVSLVDNVRSAVVDAKVLQQQREKYVVATRVSDITAVINNEVVPQLRAHVPVQDIAYFNRPRLNLVSSNVLKKSNDAHPIMHMIANSAMVPDLQHALTASASEDQRALMHDMIMRQGLDPSHILNLAPRVQSEHNVHGGLTNPWVAVETTSDPATRLLHSHIFPATSDVPPSTTDEVIDTDVVQVLQTITNDTAFVTTPVVLPAAKLRLEGAKVTQLHVVFSLIDSVTNLPIDSVTKMLDIPKHIQVYYTPRVPPIVKAATSEVSTRVNLDIKQVDTGATEVELYKKTLWTSTPEVGDYELIGTYSLTSKDQSLLVQVDMPRSSPVLYRVVPVGKQSIQSFEYTNVAVKPARYSAARSISLTAKQVDTGIQLEIRNIPTNVIAVQFLRWNMTTHESTPARVGTDVGFIDDSLRRSDVLTTIDSGVKFDNVYRYRARLIYVDGIKADAGDATLEFIKPSPGEVDTKIEDLIVSHDGAPNVAFWITTTIIDTEIDALRKMLENQGMSEYFDDDIVKQRDKLKRLIAHAVDRVDLTTGERSCFGVLTGPLFDDNAFRKNQAIGPLKYGHRYRYEVYPLLRNPETMFDEFKKTVIDQVTKKQYSFYPAKFLHPHTLKRGVIVSSNGAKLRYAKDQMSYGIIGSTTSVEVTFDHDSANIVDASASNFDRHTNVVSWKINGDINLIDHFLVMKQVHGMRSMLGKSHSEFRNRSCQYLHHITHHDIGTIQYVIVPVFNDYRLGSEVVTNVLVIERA